MYRGCISLALFLALCIFPILSDANDASTTSGLLNSTQTADTGDLNGLNWDRQLPGSTKVGSSTTPVSGTSVSPPVFDANGDLQPAFNASPGPSPTPPTSAASALGAAALSSTLPVDTGPLANEDGAAGSASAAASPPATVPFPATSIDNLPMVTPAPPTKAQDEERTSSVTTSFSDSSNTAQSHAIETSAPLAVASADPVPMFATPTPSDGTTHSHVASSKDGPERGSEDSPAPSSHEASASEDSQPSRPSIMLHGWNATSISDEAEATEWNITDVSTTATPTANVNASQGDASLASGNGSLNHDGKNYDKLGTPTSQAGTNPTVAIVVGLCGVGFVAVGAIIFAFRLTDRNPSNPIEPQV